MASKTKKFKVDPLSKANSDINVTPLVDVVLVLLIIFMVVTPLLEKDIQVRIPETEEQTEPQPETPQNQLVVAVKENGDVLLNNEPIAPDQYVERLKRVLAAKSGDDKLVFFMPDDKANYGKLITALDGAKAAGAKILGMVTTEIGAGAPGAPAEGGAPPAPTPTP